MKVGFIGLGNMGSAIARNLMKAGHDLTVYNRTRNRAQAFASLGARIAETPDEAAANAEVLITMLADDAAVEGVIFAPGNAIQNLPAGAVHISMSTISVGLSRRLAKAHRERKQHYAARQSSGGLMSQRPGSCSLLRVALPNRSNAANHFSTRLVSGHSWPARKLTPPTRSSWLGIS